MVEENYRPHNWLMATQLVNGSFNIVVLDVTFLFFYYSLYWIDPLFEVAGQNPFPHSSPLHQKNYNSNNQAYISAITYICSFLAT